MVHLLRTAAGIQDLQELSEVQKHFRTRVMGTAGDVVVVTTRNTPKRAGELQDGGSIYWIVKNIIQARQKIKGVETCRDSDGTSGCMLLLDPEIIRVMPQKHHSVQGWRYFDPQKAPRDLGAFVGNESDAPPPEMASALKQMGLL